MLVYLIRRLGQSLLAVAVMAVLVFVGVYAIGNPIDILIIARGDRARARARRSRRSASTSRSGSSSSSSSAMRCRAISAAPSSTTSRRSS